MADAPPPPEPQPRARPVVGAWNHLEVSLGQRGMGKSTHQCARALELSREAGGAYVIGHSLGARLPVTLPESLGGETLPVTYHTSLDKLAKALRRKPDRWHILAPPITGSSAQPDADRDTADDLLRYAIDLSIAVRKKAWQDANPFKFWKPTVSYDGLACPPIIVIVDEGIAIEAAGPSRKDANRWFLELLYSLRHLHIALLYAIQDGSARSWRILEQANAIHVFAVRHAWALQFIQASGATHEEIEQIKRLPKHEHVTIDSDTPRPPATVPVPQLDR